MSQILHGLYVGSLFDAKNKKQLEKIGVRNLLLFDLFSGLNIT